MLRFALCIFTMLTLAGAAFTAHATPREHTDPLCRELWEASGTYPEDMNLEKIREKLTFLPYPSAWLKDGSFDLFLQNKHLRPEIIPDWKIPDRHSRDGYMEDLENAFLYTNGSWHFCAGREETFTKGYPKAKGGHVYLRYALNRMSLHESSWASAPWESILPKDFSYELFLTQGQTVHMDELGAFVLRIRLPRIGTRTSIALAPLALAKAQPQEQDSRFASKRECAPEDDVSFLPRIFAHGSKAMVKALNEGRFDAVTEGDFQKAAAARTGVEDIPLPAGYTVEQFRKDCGDLYKIYLTHKKIAFSHIVMDWDASQERFIIVEKVHAKQHTFQSFMETMFFWFSYQL